MTSSSATPEELDVEHRLVVYGTLAPGEPNEHVMADIPGTWTPAVVRGTRVDSGRGAAFGYPGLTLDDADDVNCALFESAELPRHWPRLDPSRGRGIAASSSRYAPRGALSRRTSTSCPASEPTGKSGDRARPL
ncbi:gamma-glutamylcyclotransferase [Dermacoccus sp. 147Ba]|uniref:gamma-glutamylcyclotransferase n=1 Tax=Dermacoccus sp. 147Ba TaxID=2510111 RepID=UPI00197AA1B7|nr:gamma-glutamylcyclotransferase [Dermacoccus sp. 147Ba]